MMGGSDAPFQLHAGHGYADSMGLIRHDPHFLWAEDEEWILKKTARGLSFQEHAAANTAISRRSTVQ